MPRIAAIALGGNATSPVGEPEKTLAEALIRLSGPDVGIAAVSRFFRTPAFPPGHGADYVNAAALVRTDLAPGALLGRLHAVEASLGRERRVRWEPRTVDLDLLAVGGTILPDSGTVRDWMELSPERQRKDVPGDLVLPHPRLHQRAFVLIPLAEIAPLWRHPLTGLTVAEMCAALPPADKAAVRPIRAALSLVKPDNDA